MGKEVNPYLVQDICEMYLHDSTSPSLIDVIRLLCHCEVIPFNENNPDDVILLENLKLAADIAVKEIQLNKIRAKRANEVGNRIESFVKDALCKIGYPAHIPTTLDGKAKSAGYPDIAFIDTAGRLTYIECKTYNRTNIDTTQRSFYLSPSNEFKITGDAHHFVISLEIVEEQRDPSTGLNIYGASGWKILDIANLPLDLKIEFNSDNHRLYGGKQDFVLAEWISKEV